MTGPGDVAPPPGAPGLWRAAGPAALAGAAVLLLTASRYGLHGDEMYFRMLPPAWWYDDQPPLTVWFSHLAARASEAIWIQRVPAILTAAAGAVVAAMFPRLLGYGPTVQAVAAWAHAFTVYPLIQGHLFLTSSIDLLAWQLVTWCVVAATLRRPHALACAGLVAGLACWNKLLILVLVAALVLGLIVADRAVLRTRDALAGAVAAAVLGGPQLLAQALHGWPMSQVAAALIERQGTLNRWLVLPLILALVGPPFVGVWCRGLTWRPPGLPRPSQSPGPPRSLGPPGPSRLTGSVGRAGRKGPVSVLLVAAVALVVWTVALPSQPYYPVGVFLAAVALGWGPAAAAGSGVWRRARRVVAANAAVAALLSLPVIPPGSPAFEALAAVNPVLRDQAGWPGYVRQIAEASGLPESGSAAGAGGAADSSEVAVVTETYAVAGAVAYYGPAMGLGEVASGHNALWDLGPPRSEQVLLVGTIAATHRHLFRRCSDVGSLRRTESNPFDVAGSALARCEAPVGGWAVVWPHFRRLG